MLFCHEDLVLGGVEDLLQEHLALLIVLMSLSCKDDLHRPPGVIQNILEGDSVLQ